MTKSEGSSMSPELVVLQEVLQTLYFLHLQSLNHVNVVLYFPFCSNCSTSFVGLDSICSRH